MADPVFALDTSVIVTAFNSGVERHEVARDFVSVLLARDATTIVPLPVLVETWSVLTRLPPHVRLAGRDAMELIVANLKGRCRVVALDGEEGWGLLADAVARNAVGGTAYDLHAAACARKGGATALATFNRVHFERFAAPDLTIVVPAAA